MFAGLVIFVLELLTWVTLARWGWALGEGWSRWALAGFIPLLSMVGWGLVLSPKAVVALSASLKAALRFTVLAFAGVLSLQVWSRTVGLGFLCVLGVATLAEQWSRSHLGT